VRATWSTQGIQDSCMGMPFVGIPKEIESGPAAYPPSSRPDTNTDV